MWRFKKYILLSLGLLVVAVSLPAAEKPLNVLLIMTDDLNSDLGCYGHPVVKSPNLDRLAASGMIFNRNYCQVSLCGPSRNSMLSGLYPDQIECYKLPDLFRDRFPDAVSLPQYFMNHGYISARIGKIYHYGNPSDIGTDGVDDPASWNERYNPIGRDKQLEKDKLIETLTGKGGLGAQLSWYCDPTGTPEEHTDGKVATQAIELIDKYAQGDKPFFLAVGFYKPHTPYVSPKKYFDLYDEAQIKVLNIPASYLNTIPEEAAKRLGNHPGEKNITEEQARKAMHAYYAAISFVDDQIGRVLNELDKLHLRDQTIILFSSDNGYHLGEHRHWQKLTLFDNADRIPLIISYPGMKTAGTKTDSLVELVDYYPTLSELAGLPPPPSISGKSMVPVLTDPKTEIRTSALTQLGTDGYTIITPRYRYTRWEKGAPQNVELYDRQNDPDEMNNLAGNPEQKELLRTLDQELQKRIDEGRELPSGLVPAEKHKKNDPKKAKNEQRKETDE